MMNIRLLFNRIVICRPALVLLAWISASLALHAQQVVPSLSVDTNRMLIGRQLKVQIQLSQPKNLQVDWPVFQDTIGGMEIIAIQPPDTFKVEDPSLLLRSQTLIVSSFDSGRVMIPPVSFNYRLPGNDKVQTVETDPLFVDVFPVPVDTTKAIRDIRPVEDAPFDYLLLLWPAVLLLLAAIAWYSYRRWKKRPVAVTELPPVQVRPAHVTALEELDKLNQERIWQQGQFKLYHTRLTDILRVYIEQRWLVSALESTTDEILGHGFFSSLKVETGEQLERVLRLADLVKFAKMQPLSSDNELAMQLAVSFVKETSMFGEREDSKPNAEKQ